MAKSRKIRATLTLKEGDPAPDFTLPDDMGKPVRLSDYRGRYVVIYFYPKDDTPGCTQEACDFRDNLNRLKALDVEVLGISVDPVASHRKFKEKYHLNFPLLSDEQKEVVQLYGVWKEKKRFGRTYMGTERTTLIVDPEGTIVRIFPRVRVKGHVNEVIQALKELRGNSEPSA